ncbi:MAG: hypothetical protein KTR29_19090 [Rhodothermaceae bacterium]|nr:hypothetical protein [Rhodothermaceae bacterium]
MFSKGTITIPKSYSPLLFLLATVCIYLFAGYAVDYLSSSPNPGLLAIAIAADLIITVAILYYVLLIRGRGWPVLSIVPLCFLSILGAKWLLPSEHLAIFDYSHFILIPLELAIIGIVGFKAYGLVRRYKKDRNQVGTPPDILVGLQQAAFEITGSKGFAKAVAFELAIFYYTFLSWAKPLSQSTNGFTYHKKVGYTPIFMALMCMALIELVVVHVVVWALGAELVAWILTGISIYGILWLIGDYRAVLRRHIEVNENELVIRVGLRYTAVLPLNQIQYIRKWPTKKPFEKRPGFMNAVVFGKPHYEIQLSRPIKVQRLYGMEKEIHSFGICIDDRERFEAILHELSHGRLNVSTLSK